MRNTNIISNSVAVACLAIVGCLMYCMAGHVEKKIALIIDSVELSGRTELTIGNGSDVNFNRVPHDYLTITCEGDSFKWEVNKEYQDSLQYFKINNKNPNNHAIYNDQRQVISLRLSTSSGDVLPIEFTGADVWRTWNDFKDQKDVMARHFATYFKLSQANVNHQDSVKWFNQMQQQTVRSFFEKQEGTLVMVILDENSTIRSPKSLLCENEPGDTLIQYQRKGRTSSDGETSRCCKVQFFDITDYCYKNDYSEDGFFKIDSVNYVMKATVKLTEWGAGHAMIKSRHDDSMNCLSVFYPKPITFVGSADTLRDRSRQSSGLVTLKQNNKSFPTKSDLFLPTFSNAINYDLCNIEFNQGNDTIKVRDNNFNIFVVEENAFSFSNIKGAIIPTLKRVKLHSGNDILNCRLGFIGQKFIHSYLFLTLIVLIVLLCLVWWPWNPKKSPLKLSDSYVYNPQQLKHYQLFITMLLLVCMSYCICKSLIALKLSYTYPYFEKITGVIPASTSLMMLLFFSLSMVLNRTFVKQKPIGNLINWGVTAILYIALWFVFFNVIDPTISQGLKDSYFDHEISISSCPLNWAEMVGVNDTHRSVVYTLILVEGAVLLLWLSFGVWSFISSIRFFKKMENSCFTHCRLCFDKLRSLFDGSSLIVTFSNKIRSLFRWVLIIASWMVVAVFFWRINMTYCWNYSLGGKIALILLVFALITLGICFFIPFVYKAFCKTIKTLFPWHFMILGILMVLGNVSGNFSTAFITLVVILGLSKALSSTVSEMEQSMHNGEIVSRHCILCQMFFITLFYIGCAMVGDNGYLTNYLGFFMCIFIFFFLVERPDEFDSYASETETRREKIWVPVLMTVLVIYIVALPMLCSFLFSPEKVDYSRMSRRLMLYSNFDELQKSGYRYSESDAEFMVILSHYMQQGGNNDPLSNDSHCLHTSVSTGQSPVVLNDLSAPIAFFGSYGIMSTSIVYFILLALLTWLVLTYSYGYQDDNSTLLTLSMQWRLLALMMWVGTSLYIYFSYIDCLPFTGRLNPGLGVDSVGESLETAILLAFMTAVTYREE